MHHSLILAHSTCGNISLANMMPVVMCSPLSTPTTGVPLSPNATVANITSRGALISWSCPFSIPSVIWYNVTWLHVDTGGRHLAAVGADMTKLLLTDLRPNQIYHVAVVAVNRVGASLPSNTVFFSTAESGRFEIECIHCLFLISKCAALLQRAAQVNSFSFHSLCSTRFTSR